MFSARQASKKEVTTNPLRLDQLGQEKERVKMQVLGMSKDAQDTSGLFNDIFSFNNQIAKGFVYCLQNQMNLAQIFMELVQTFENDKLWEYFSTKSILQSEEKNMRIGETPSHDFFSIQNQTGKDKSLGFVSSKIERMIGDLSNLLGSYQNDASTDTYKGYLSTSPLGSSRTWTQDVKRGSVPVVVNKSKDFNSIIPMKTQPDYSIDDRRASTGNSKLVSGLRASQTVVTEPDADSTSAKRFIKSKQATLNKNKSTTMGTNVSPRNPEEIMDRTKYSSFAQEDSKFSHARQAMKAPSREVHRNLERERMMSDKFALKPTMGHIPKKDLVEESLHGGDRTVNSSATSHARAQNNETARMFRLGEFEDNSLIMSLNNTKDIPMSEKKAIKDLIKEEREELARNNMKGGDKKNLIDAKWWRAWKEYVNFDCDNDFQSVIIGIYSRPGRILNKGLLKYEVIKDFGQMSGGLELRDHLLEHHDYEVVSKKVFDMLSKWYGCDFELVRSLKIDPFRKNKLVLDLYPDKGFAEIKSRIAKFKSVSPKDGTRPGNVISSIIHTNLVNYSGKSRHDSKNAY